jgi:DNA repair photolyase
MEETEARSIFSPATGYIRRGGFDWTCNPYVGCTFGCTYCYAMFLPQNRRPKEDWGKWLQVKKNAVDLARRQGSKVAGQAVYISSVTDPYVPIEKRLRLTRGILESLVPHQPRVLIQTRGPNVKHDLDVLKQFRAVRVNITIPTDDEAVREAFEPKAPTLQARWTALSLARKAGVPIGICVTPMLPVKDCQAFTDRIVAFNPDVLVVQDFHDSGGRFGADTGAKAKRLVEEWKDRESEYRQFKKMLATRVKLWEGEKGFFPPEANRS